MKNYKLIVFVSCSTYMLLGTTYLYVRNDYKNDKKFKDDCIKLLKFLPLGFLLLK